MSPTRRASVAMSSSPDLEATHAPSLSSAPLDAAVFQSKCQAEVLAASHTWPAASRRADDVLEVMRQLEQQNAGDYAQAEQFLAAQERKTRAGAAAAAAAAAAMGVRVEGGLGLSPSQFLESR